MNPTIRRIGAVLPLAVLGACASAPTDGGLAALQELTRPRVGQVLEAARTPEEIAHAAARARVMLEEPLDAERAVAVALLNNPRVRTVLAQVGAAEAELAQAARPRNPGFSWAKYRQGGEREIERRIVLDVVGLVTLPLRHELERGNMAAARQGAALEIVRIADEARRAWIEAVAGAEAARYADQVVDAARAGATLAEAMERAGHFNRIARSREELFRQEALAQAAGARLAARIALERLARVLGLDSTALVRLPHRLPDPPTTARDGADAEATAIANRIDVAAARREMEATARALGLTRVTRFINVLHLGYEWSTSNEAPRRTGYEVELEIPLFDWGQSRMARAEATYREAASRLAETVTRARSEVRVGLEAREWARELARRHRDEIVPLRQRISEEQLLRYNGMLVGVFDLLMDARARIAAVVASIEATREFWLAEANLEMALVSGSPGSPSIRSAAPASAPAAAH